MKKILVTIGTAIILSQIILATSGIVFAANDQPPASNNQTDKKAGIEDVLLNPFVDSASKSNTEGSKAKLVEGLPTGTWQEILSDAVKLLLGISGTLSLASFTIGGVLLLTAQGDETKVGNAKKLIMWSLLALGIIATSYAIVLGVSQLQFLGPQK